MHRMVRDAIEIVFALFVGFNVGWLARGLLAGDWSPVGSGR